MVVKMSRFLHRWLAHLDGIVFHEQCRRCFSLLPPTILAKECHGLAVDDIPKTICISCWRQCTASKPVVESHLFGEHSLTIASGGLYSGPLKRLVYRLKYDNDRLLAHDLALLADRALPLVADAFVNAYPVLVPIPLYPDRMWERGFNQAEEIAKHISRRFSLKMEKHGLQRTKKTEPQFGLTRIQRHSNISGAFSGNARLISGKVVILVDDVFTSGATLLEAAQAVQSCGAVAVTAVTAVRAVHQGVQVDTGYHSDNIKEEPV